MDIALTVGSFDLRGGIERTTVQLARSYRALGHAVTIYAADWDREVAEGFHMVRVEAPDRPAWLRTLRLPAAMTRALGRHDVVHGHGTSTFACDLLTFHSVHAAWVAACIATEGPLAPRSIAKRVLPFHRLTVATERRQVREHRGLFHAMAPEIADELVTFYGAPRDRIVVIPWGVDLEAFSPDAASGAAERATWGVPADAKVLTLVANELARKGLATILGAMAKLGREDVYLVVAGREDVTPWRALAERLGVASRVRFLGSRDPAPVYRGADLFVMPSSYEGWGLVVAEALACGTPVLCSRFPGAVAMVEPGRNGLLVDDPRDEGALAAAIEAALAPEALARMGAAARPSVERYGWLAIARELAEAGARGAALRRG